MRKRVLLTEDISPKGIRYLTEHGCELVMGTGVTESDILRDIVDCDGVLTRNGDISGQVLSSAPQLKVVAMHGVGVDRIDVKTASSRGVYVTNTPDANTNSVAEFTVSLIFALAKNTVLYNNRLREGNWDIRKTFGTDLEGKTLGVIGMGHIGSLVAQKAAAGLGMRVIGYKRNLRDSGSGHGNIVITDDMNTVIRNADFLSVHLPYTEQTAGIIGEAELSLMKPGAYLINTARGEVVDTAALCRALRDKKIAGAAIDVFDGGVPESDNPLLHMDNVIVTPHAAAFTKQSLDNMAVHAAQGIIEVLEGRAPTWPVNNPVLLKRTPARPAEVIAPRPVRSARAAL